MNFPARNRSRPRAGCLTFLLLFLAGLSLVTSAARAQGIPAGSAGVVSALQGTVTLTRGMQSLPVVHGTAVQVGDRLSTAPNSAVTVTLSDGTQLELAAASVLVISEERLDAQGHRVATRLELLGGLLHSLVRFAPGIAPNYEVHTPNAVAAARGTTYDTDYAQGQPRKGFTLCREFTDIAVFDGTVEVTNPTNKTAGSVAVERGHKTTVPCGLAPLSALAASGAATTSSATIAGGAMLGGSLAGAAVVGGVGASGGFGDGNPMTPSQ